MTTTASETTPARAPGTVPALVLCSASGCRRPATWRRQSWVRNMRDQPICDEHIGFYRACGLACTPIHTQNNALTQPEH